MQCIWDLLSTEFGKYHLKSVLVYYGRQQSSFHATVKRCIGVQTNIVHEFNWKRILLNLPFHQQDPSDLQINGPNSVNHLLLALVCSTNLNYRLQEFVYDGKTSDTNKCLQEQFV